MSTKEIVYKAAAQLGLPPKYVWEVYRAYWKFIRNYISSLPLKENLTKEEFEKLRTNINIPSLGHFTLDWDRLEYKKKENERFKNKKDKTSVHNSSNNT